VTIIDNIYKAKQGDKQAFESLYLELYEPLFRFVRFRLCGDQERASDVCQDTFLKWYQSLDRYEPTIKPINYLITIATRIMINEGKRKKVDELSEDAEDFVASNDETVENLLTTEMDFDKVREIIDTELNELEKSIITLKYISQLDNQEIAEILNKTEGNVRVIEHRALKKIKESYGKKYDK
jgi:RNA polymerase sigma-70 factor (ECF subfamily)